MAAATFLALAARDPLSSTLPPMPDAGPLAVTVSGGASLGAYEAGYLYYVSEAIAHDGVAASPATVGGGIGR